VFAYFLGCFDACLCVTCLLLCFVSELLRLAFGFLGGGARGLSGLVR
jgi:hypothetical protein